MKTIVHVKDKKEALEKEFSSLVIGAEEGTIPFEELGLRWTHFFLKVKFETGISPSSAARKERETMGWPAENDNERIIPSLAKSFGHSWKNKRNVSVFVQGIKDMMQAIIIFVRFREEGNRLWKLTDHPLSDFFTYMECEHMEKLRFLLNLSDNDRVELESLFVENKRKRFSFKQKEILEAEMKECLLEGKKDAENFEKSMDYIDKYPNNNPQTETMHGWILEKYNDLPVETLKRYAEKTRSHVITKALLARPDHELSFDLFLQKVKLSE